MSTADQAASSGALRTSMSALSKTLAALMQKGHYYPNRPLNLSSADDAATGTTVATVPSHTASTSRASEGPACAESATVADAGNSETGSVATKNQRKRRARQSRRAADKKVELSEAAALAVGTTAGQSSEDVQLGGIFGPLHAAAADPSTRAALVREVLSSLFKADVNASRIVANATSELASSNKQRLAKCALAESFVHADNVLYDMQQDRTWRSYRAGQMDSKCSARCKIPKGDSASSDHAECLEGYMRAAAETYVGLRHLEAESYEVRNRNAEMAGNLQRAGRTMSDALYDWLYASKNASAVARTTETWSSLQDAKTAFADLLTEHFDACGALDPDAGSLPFVLTGCFQPKYAEKYAREVHPYDVHKDLQQFVQMIDLLEYCDGRPGLLQDMYTLKEPSGGGGA